MSLPKVMISNVELVSIDGLTLHPKNRNKHPKEQIERLARILEYQGFRYPVKVSKRSGFVTSGHGRIEAARLNGWTHVPVSYQDYETEEQEYADLIADNSIASWAELDLSGINADLGDLGPDFDLDLLGLRDFSLDMSEKELSEEEMRDLYTKKIEIPIYEPKGEKPSFEEMYSTEKTKELLKEIEATDLDEETKAFLRKAAERHTVFNYEKIAEFYCHQPRRIKDLMENSALVLIDFDKAIEKGFVQMTKDIAEAYDADEE